MNTSASRGLLGNRPELPQDTRRSPLPQAMHEGRTKPDQRLYRPRAGQAPLDRTSFSIKRQNPGELDTCTGPMVLG